MSSQEIAAAMQRVEAILQRRPDVAMHSEAPASARWEGGTRIVATHANGSRMATNMPTELGGSGQDVTPGWLFSPISNAVASAVPVDLRIDVDAN